MNVCRGVRSGCTAFTALTSRSLYQVLLGSLKQALSGLLTEEIHFTVFKVFMS